MKNLLSIGTVIDLKNGEHKIMITSRTPLMEEKGVLGYFDYGACLYPEGQLNSQNFFFNEEDIEKIYFEGYCDEDEMECRKKYEEEIQYVKYPKLHIDNNK